MPAALAAFLLTGGQQAVAGGSWTIKIVNDLSVELTSGKVVNRQDIQIKSHPPTTIAAGASAEFTVADGDSIKNIHLKVQYTVDSSGSETIEFGVKDDPGFKCFVETPSDIVGSITDCNTPTDDPTVYKFSAN
jgi:hypothetical protein